MANTEPSTFREYLEQIFPKEVADCAQKIFDEYRNKSLTLPSNCPHHGVPSDRALPFDWGVLKGCEPRFICALYTTTLLHEAVHALEPESNAKWLESFGAHPIPMCPSGFGCFRAVEPCMLLLKGPSSSRKLPSELWSEVCDYFLNDVPGVLRKAGIDPKRFFAKVLKDSAFGKNNIWRQSEYEKQLAERLAEVWV